MCTVELESYPALHDDWAIATRRSQLLRERDTGTTTTKSALSVPDRFMRIGATPALPLAPDTTGTQTFFLRHER